MSVFISVVVAAYNEEAVIEQFYERTARVLESISPDYEILVVNDGSRDSTAAKVRALHQKDARVKLVDLSRNFGKEIAMSAGLDFASGEVVVVTDADLQDPPELITEMLAKWREGYDTVYATRTLREGETALKKLTAGLFYRIMNQFSRTQIPEDTGDFRLMSRRTVQALRLLREENRFMKGVFTWVGFNQVGIPYERAPRAAGETKWNYWRLLNFAIEGITSFSYVPLQISTYVGVITAIFAFLYAGFLIIRTLLFGIDVPGYASLMVAILFFSGCQLTFLGIIGEYLGRMFEEIKRRPLYLVQEVLGLEPNSPQVLLRPKP
ncbi:MAG: glycosyltransferase family 2 protein [Candidatus Omnitrophica bacterium]|nr:glycosyltransferase family 2 protein [Candidatus Omnitrophota bacterium]